MTITGEDLYNMVHVAWGLVPPITYDKHSGQSYYEKLADLINKKIHQPTSNDSNLLVSYLKTYGRHKPNCMTLTTCQCGFEQVEKYIKEVDLVNSPSKVEERK